MAPIWAWFGYDEPNYTYRRTARKLLSELPALSPVPVYVRAHNLLTSGDGTAALKWGSTNAYSEDANGRPIYDWTIVDRILDTYVERNMKPSSRSASCRRRCPASRSRIGTTGTCDDTAGSSPAGAIRRLTTISGDSWSTMGPPFGGQVWPDGSRELVVGGLERARHRLLARHTRGIPKLYDYAADGAEARAADGPHWWTARHRAQWCATAGVSRELPRALPARDQLRTGRRVAARLRRLPREGRATGGPKATCAWA